MDGGAGNDDLYGEDGHDIIYGGTGNDKLNGDAGNDVLFGGTGTDTLSGNTGNDTLYGEAGDDFLYGDEGHDKLFGGSGKDILSGGDGNDTLYGEDGNDKLFGGTGNDILFGGTGDDELTGGSGKDIFVYNNGDGKDIIADYDSGEDLIQICNSTIGKVVYDDKDTILTIGKGTITVKNSLGKVINVQYIDGTKEELKEEADISNVTVTLDANYGGVFDLSEYNKRATTKAVNIDATNVKADSWTQNRDYLEIIGNERANVIRVYDFCSSIKPGKGDDTVIWDGKGHKAIRFSNEDGNDTVYGFNTPDTNPQIWLENSRVENMVLRGKDLVMKIVYGNDNLKSTKPIGTITLKDITETPGTGSIKKTIFISGEKLNDAGAFYGCDNSHVYINYGYNSWDDKRIDTIPCTTDVNSVSAK